MKPLQSRSGGCRARAAVLGVELRAVREEKPFGVRELARRVGISPAQLSSWELGIRSPSPTDVAGILGALGVVGERKHRILQIAEFAESDVIVLGQAGRPSHIAVANACASTARSIVDWHPLLVPDTLRTPTYAKAVQLATFPRGVAAQVVLNARTRALTSHSHKQEADLAVFVGERALTHPLVDPAVTAQQLRFLLELADERRARKTTINVVPDHSAGAETAFTRYYTHVGPITYFPHGLCGSFMLDHQDAYSAVIDRLAVTAYQPRESAALIAQHAARLDLELKDAKRGAGPAI
ncbi:helix-turn-helix transcriptional regulator [Amycolatopsis rubida]|uniref:Helix-turn-helix transcriptional regulator n=1 Tax=Amycolatopsis rubida TaxID=112413 RepID=A0ABX0BSN5_9PSEU|nr:Scr1 family TA system antitoxin-like transcriptional regulator [Amycolatopsis sp. M39]MYW92407.1 helix-turn-helix domain-containing protein [Amycolatopsis rubida]NEC57395.1 helix-turn-helix transcriptional regulator [Amycolatopsis rubida]OAP20708.1 helix-turn-helix protein [Amycolatopsis sp. M39]